MITKCKPAMKVRCISCNVEPRKRGKLQGKEAVAAAAAPAVRMKNGDTGYILRDTHNNLNAIILVRYSTASLDCTPGPIDSDCFEAQYKTNAR